MQIDDNWELMKQEDTIIEKIDKNNDRWIKKYVGGGAHFLNRLAQFREIYGEKTLKLRR